ncbi:hypothetical protein [Nonomuraea diastatica]|uniref:Uncharacterized protein n=1 Tax=Nonomuraea diastatica TaxID=1848329 RepID=A0A4R4X0M9_9ACTN|nr:hypothetical protein [Nonomuraea diastatica]TDD23651.1 hypothetical protein E1294_07945 [Nonomuraea diastatica]
MSDKRPGKRPGESRDGRPGEPPHEQPDRRPDARLVAAADIVFSATVRADSVAFEEAPSVAVTFSGEPAHESGSGSRRTGLPEHVSEGETYRAVRVGYVIAAKVVADETPGADEDP